MSLPRFPRAVVFDMDGLLCDTEVVYRDAMAATATELGHDMPMSLFRSMIGLPGPMSDRQVLNHFGEDFPIAAFNARERYLDVLRLDAVLMDLYELEAQHRDGTPHGHTTQAIQVMGFGQGAVGKSLEQLEERKLVSRLGMNHWIVTPKGARRVEKHLAYMGIREDNP